MLVLIDESGDTGFKASSSRYFVMTLVVFCDKDDCGRYAKAEHTASVIKDACNQLKTDQEFHFSKCSHKFRMTFFKSLNANNCDFKVYALVVDKQKIHSVHMKTNTKSFYNFILKQLLAKNPIRNGNIKIDGSKSKIFKKEFIFIFKLI